MVACVLAVGLWVPGVIWYPRTRVQLRMRGVAKTQLGGEPVLVDQAPIRSRLRTRSRSVSQLIRIRDLVG